MVTSKATAHGVVRGEVSWSWPLHTRRVRCDLCARGLQRLVGELGQGHVRINLNPGRCPSSAERTD